MKKYDRPSINVLELSATDVMNGIFVSENQGGKSELNVDWGSGEIIE